MTLFYEPLSRDDVDRINTTTMEILERAGVLVENENVLDMIEKAGGEIEKKRGIAKIPEYVIKGAIQKVPRSLVLHSRDGKVIKIGGLREPSSLQVQVLLG